MRAPFPGIFCDTGLGETCKEELTRANIREVSAPIPWRWAQKQALGSVTAARAPWVAWGLETLVRQHNRASIKVHRSLHAKLGKGTLPSLSCDVHHR